MKNKNTFVQKPEADAEYCLALALGITIEELQAKIEKLEHVSMLSGKLSELTHPTTILHRILSKRFKFYAYAKNKFVSVNTLANHYPNRTMLVATRYRKGEMAVLLIENSEIISKYYVPRLFVDCFWITKGPKIKI